jgi:hypothetical protein
MVLDLLQFVHMHVLFISNVYHCNLKSLHILIDFEKVKAMKMIIDNDTHTKVQDMESKSYMHVTRQQSGICATSLSLPSTNQSSHVSLESTSIDATRKKKEK